MEDKKKKKKKSKSKSGLSSSSTRTSLSVFDAVDRLQSQDDSVARRKRSASSVKQERANSRAALSQQSVYTKLLETRILLQRSLQHQHGQQDNNNNDNNSALDQCNDLLVKLLTARRQLLKRSLGSNEHANDEDEADDDDDDDNIVDYESLLVNDRPSKKAKATGKSTTATEEETQVLPSLEDQLQTEFETCQAEWQSVLNRRNHDVRLHTGAITAAQSQFRVVHSNFWQQVESTVLHQKQRHALSSTATATAAGQDHDSDSDEDKEKEKSSISYPAFDDAKIYQQLLKDFVAVSSADHASQAGAASLAAQARLDKALRKKNKASASALSSSSKLVDRRASKGRKIRYTTMPKLVNFTFPLSRGGSRSSTGSNTEQQPSSLDEDAWFKSMFGGTAAAAAAAAAKRTEN